MEYKLVSKNGVDYLVFKSLEKAPFIRHGFSTRTGGVSRGAYRSLNLGFKTGDKEDRVRENISRFALAVGVDQENLVISDQVHKDRVRVVGKEDRGKGYLRPRDFSQIDGLVTNIVGLGLMTIYADCVPIYFLDPVQRAIGLSHAGWRGTRLKIGQKTVETMVGQYGSRPEDMVALIGPSIGSCCYEVDRGLVEEFNKNFTDSQTFIFPYGASKYKLDLWEANRLVLREAGLLDSNIKISNLCTSCNLDLFYSHRREKGNTGRMAAIIQLI